MNGKEFKHSLFFNGKISSDKGLKVLVISDIHGNYKYLDKIREDVDLIIVCGDLTDFGTRIQASKIITKLKKLCENILAIPGNCDKYDVNKYLEEIDVSIHMRFKKISDYVFFGLGGSSITPFNTVQEFSEEEIFKNLNEVYVKLPKSEKKVLVTHSPPYQTKVDITLSKVHAGSKAIRKFLEKKRDIYICFCGHIHEARGYDYIGGTLVINPGNIYRGYVLINLDEKKFIFKKV